MQYLNRLRPFATVPIAAAMVRTFKGDAARLVELILALIEAPSPILMAAAATAGATDDDADFIDILRTAAFAAAPDFSSRTRFRKVLQQQDTS